MLTVIKDPVCKIEQAPSGEVADCNRLNHLCSPLPFQPLLAWPALVCVGVIVQGF